MRMHMCACVSATAHSIPVEIEEQLSEASFVLRLAPRQHLCCTAMCSVPRLAGP